MSNHIRPRLIGPVSVTTLQAKDFGNAGRFGCGVGRSSNATGTVAGQRASGGTVTTVTANLNLPSRCGGLGWVAVMADGTCPRGWRRGGAASETPTESPPALSTSSAQGRNSIKVEGRPFRICRARRAASWPANWWRQMMGLGS
jgi:hypothetical protein